MLPDHLQQGCFRVLCLDLAAGAGRPALARLPPTQVVAEGGYVAARAIDPADHGRAAFAAAGQSRKKEEAFNAARVPLLIRPRLPRPGTWLQRRLDGIPGLTVHERLKRTLDLQLAALLDAQIRLVPEHGDVAVSHGKDARRLHNLLVGCAGGSHLECLAHPWGDLGIDQPATDDVRLAVAFCTDLDALHSIAARRKAARGKPFLGQVVKATPDVAAQILEVTFVLPIDQCFYDRGKLTKGHVIRHGMEHVAAQTEVRLDELGCQLLAGQAGERPEDDAVDRPRIAAGHVQQIFQPIAPHRRGAWAGLVGEDLDDLQVVAPGIVFDGPALGGHAVLLLFAAAVAAVGPNSVTRFERAARFDHPAISPVAACVEPPSNLGCSRSALLYHRRRRAGRGCSDFIGLWLLLAGQSFAVACPSPDEVGQRPRDGGQSGSLGRLKVGIDIAPFGYQGVRGLFGCLVHGSPTHQIGYASYRIPSQTQAVQHYRHIRRLVAVSGGTFASRCRRSVMAFQVLNRRQHVP